MTPKARIIIADPDFDIRETLKLYLESNGHEVQTLSDSQEILKKARPWQPHVILMSTEFSNVDPYQICRTLLEDTLTGHIPLIMLLHTDERQARLEALEAGVGDLITKPFDIEELRLRVEATIRLSTMQVSPNGGY
ncbi:MAG: response regulator [Chloroflexota bacterium]